jgi:hypothetical protein
LGGLMWRASTVALCLLLCGAVLAAETPDQSSSCVCQCERRGSWLTAETANFVVWTHLDESATRELAVRCEKLRSSLRASWLGFDGSLWIPKCAIVLHAGATEYQNTLGTPEVSVGCTTVTCDQGRIVFRRIDLRNDAQNWRENALPHELTHVVVSERWLDGQIPTWLNEGLAMTSESAQLQEDRLDMLEAACRSPELLPVNIVLADDHAGARLDPNLRYAVSLSLTRFLLQQGDREQLLRFAELVTTDGYEQALRETYAIEGGIGALESQWVASLPATQPVNSAAVAER